MQSIKKCVGARLVVLAAGLVPAAAVCGANAQLTPDPFQYLLDDGAGNFNIGPSSFDANMTWLNTFTAEPGYERIDKVLAAFGPIENDDGVPGSDLVTVAVLNDPNNDGDPADAVLLATGTGTWYQGVPNEFLEFDLDETAVVEGTFFVAVVMDVLERANPARMDPQGQGAGEHSWMFYNPELNLDNLGDSPYILHMSESPFIGAWMIRAQAEKTAVCVADLAEPFGTLNFFDVAEYMSLFGSEDPAADVAEPFGTFNFFDVSAFIASYNAGCP